MKITNRLLLAACLVLPLAACKKEEAAPVEVAQAALVAPDKSDEAGWKAYLSDVVLRNMGEITNQPFLYYLPTQADPEFQAKYDRQLEQAKNAIARGIVGGNLIAFGSPESAKMADIAVASFTGVPADTMKKVKIVFIGDAVDSERVQAVVTPTGADYVFVEAKCPFGAWPLAATPLPIGDPRAGGAFNSRMAGHPVPHHSSFKCEWPQRGHSLLTLIFR